LTIHPSSQKDEGTGPTGERDGEEEEEREEENEESRQTREFILMKNNALKVGKVP
jgi:hypothetical protein